MQTLVHLPGQAGQFVGNQDGHEILPLRTTVVDGSRWRWRRRDERGGASSVSVEPRRWAPVSAAAHEILRVRPAPDAGQPAPLAAEPAHLLCSDHGQPTTPFFFFQAEDGIRAPLVTGVQTCALPI